MSAGAALDAASADEGIFVRPLAGMKGLGGCQGKVGISAMLPLQLYRPAAPISYQRCFDATRAGCCWSVTVWRLLLGQTGLVKVRGSGSSHAWRFCRALRPYCLAQVVCLQVHGCLPNWV